MKTTLIQSQIDDYRKNGFLVIDEFLTPDELAVWRCAVDDAVAAKCPPARNNEYYDNVFQQRVNLWQDSEALKLPVPVPPVQGGD